MRAQRGFTLIELAVVVAVIGLLSTIAMPLAQLNVQRSKEQDLRRALREIRGAIDAYRQAVKDNLIQRKEGATGYPPRLEDLTDGVVDQTSPSGAKIYFLRRLPRDPFYPDNSALPAETWGKRAYASPPDAPQVGDDVFDVYSQSEGVGLNGIPYRSW
ncbi:MAG: type II secretion system protein [Rhodocyclaceae bacterium]|nr:MAG: type II secretion system protein [Rhodocyclaceae bacterium]